MSAGFESMTAANTQPAAKLCAVLACHNRKAKTLHALSALYESAGEASVELQVILVDDASHDGTPEAVRDRFPAVEILPGTGDLFWNQAMRRGIARALQSPPDFLLLLNDDTFLDRPAVQRLVTGAQANPEAILVGTVRDPDTGEYTYGGRRRYDRFNPLLFELVAPDPETFLPCDTFNGNCVLVPCTVLEHIGNLAPEFRHTKGDTDYGLRARAAGFEVLVAPGTYGTCRREKTVESRKKPRGLRDLYDFATHPKRQPLRERFVFQRRHGNRLWWLFALAPYLTWIKRRFRRNQPFRAD
ncbi:MAG: glycosyltransferase family 2 protein [Gammaproteobacteria bacterium]|nr:glycosyltransferase family 2 protein [Gammaproteobacteria bacterium]